ncbi:oxidoreductase [Marinobacter halodurans]|uniref:Oxidoreductase n=1 Tax=Marinobacter halodurans TaxID=2528979 RepID=A0ABY1ZF79_9GAMM|nr:oxidoreductase [Marinobacter halodurans]TBW49240.1 oxidoreductase [Marinobacter halodurans]
MNDHSDVEQSLFEGLRALSDSAFPKRCANCGREYESPDSFVRQSASLGQASGLKQGYDDDDSPIVELFRNCVCGSTLMDVFEDRRDDSPAGQRRREIFGKLLDRLSGQGMAIQEARRELKRLMRGDESPALEEMGIHLKTRR